MALPRLSNLEMQIMEIVWDQGSCSIRDIQEKFVAKKPPAYTTVQTMVYRLEAKKALRRTDKSGPAHLFEAVISQDAARRRVIDDFLAIFGGEPQPIMSHLVKGGKLSLEDVREVERHLRTLLEKEKKKP